MFPSEVQYPGDDLLPATLVSPEVSTPAILEEQLQASRVAQAGTAIATLVQDYGLATVGDLMAVLGIETVARLLAMLGFTGDLDGLACEIAPLLAQPISDVAHPVRDSA